MKKTFINATFFAGQGTNDRRKEISQALQEKAIDSAKTGSCHYNGIFVKYPSCHGKAKGIDFDHDGCIKISYDNQTDNENVGVGITTAIMYTGSFGRTGQQNAPSIIIAGMDTDGDKTKDYDIDFSPYAENKQEDEEDLNLLKHIYGNNLEGLK
jgi:hypothetical protein